MKEGNNNDGSFWFLVDNTRVVFIEEYNDDYSSPQGTGSIILELRAGQSVRIENNGSTEVYGLSQAGHLRSWFTGFLLYTLV